jgi:hypothetical protein
MSEKTTAMLLPSFEIEHFLSANDHFLSPFNSVLYHSVQFNPIHLDTSNSSVIDDYEDRRKMSRGDDKGRRSRPGKRREGVFREQ